MPNYRKLDQQHRLTPWLDRRHAEYVAGQYGSLLGTGNGAKAAEYLRKYREKEAEFDEADKGQREYLKTAPTLLGSPAQELPEVVKVDWDPTKRVQTGDGGDGGAPATPEEKKAARAKELDRMTVPNIDPILESHELPVEGNKQAKIDAILAKEFPAQA